MRIGHLSLFAVLTILPFSASTLQTPTQFNPAKTTYPVFETDKITPSEHAQRRESVKAKMAPNSLAVLFTNHEHLRNNDCDFKFRADSNFMYLSGFTEPDAALILAPNGIEIDGKRTTEVLFVNERNLQSETWLGYRMGSKDGKVLLGIETVLPNTRFREVLSGLSPEKVMTTSIPEGHRGTLGQMNDAYTAWLAGRAQIGGLEPIIGNLRAIKSPDEIRLMQRAVDASIEGHAEAIRSCQPGMREYALQAVHEYCFRKNGCEAEAYDCIVGGGANATILHYMSDRAVLKAGDLLLMDCAGEYHGYAADVTRTIPVSGKFSPEQRAIYDLVLAAQNAGIKALVPGGSPNAGHIAATKVITEGLLKLGIIKDAKDFRKYFMHGTSHTVGLDVHDTRAASLQPGVVLTVEPGIYIKAGSPCDKKWWDIGVRIEDDILITKDGPVNMSGALPRDADSLEKMMRGKGIGNVATKLK